MIGVVFQQMMVFLTMLLVGIFAARKGLVTNEALSSINTMTQRIFLPVMVLGFVYRNLTADAVATHWPMLPLTACFYAVAILLALALSQILGLRGGRACAFRLSFTFGNTGFIGLPLLAAVHGAAGVVDLMLFMVVDQVIFWTLGIREASPAERKPSLAESLKGLANPNLIAFAIGDAVVALGIEVPAFLAAAVDSLGAVASPLCMVCIGCMCVYSQVARVVRQREFYVGVALKMVLLPIACAPLLMALPLGDGIASSLILMMAMPATTLVPLAVAREGGDERAATRMAVGTIAVSTLTVPLVALIAGI